MPVKIKTFEVRLWFQGERDYRKSNAIKDLKIKFKLSNPGK